MIIYGDLPPVGHRISLQSSAENSLVEFLGRHQYWVDSGTSALALALLDAKTYFSKVKNPRVIIPGYCCPDLVAACVYAGVEPLVIDIAVNDPAYSHEQLRAQLDERVIAIIAVNFLGIAERLSELRQLIYSLGFSARLIEDNAQWFPAHQADISTEADYTIFSFGRGKPLSLLGGGLLLAHTQLADAVTQTIGAAEPYTIRMLLKIHAYNLLLTPQLYFFLNRNPFLHLGETKYDALEKIQVIDDFRLTRVNENFALYAARSRLTLAAHYDSIVVANGLQQLSAQVRSRGKQLLRYPLLCANAEQQNNLLAEMRKLGLGATAMYAETIDKIAGVNGRVCVPGQMVNAKSFARRFITLPLHSGVTDVYREKILAVLQTTNFSD